MKRLILASLLSLSVIAPVQATPSEAEIGAAVELCKQQMFRELDAKPALEAYLDKLSETELKSVVADAYDSCLSLLGY